MNKIRKFMLFTLCAVVAFSAAACAGKDNTDSKTDTAEQSVTRDTDIQVSPEENETKAPFTTDSVAESPAVDASYFDDAAFVGDSVSLKLSYYAMSTGKLSKAQFFTAGSLGSANALWDISDESVHPSYQGTKMLVEDCIQLSGAKKVYIMLGMNDLALYGIDDTIVNFTELVNRIKAKSPDVQIVVQSMTPMTDTSTIFSDDLNNDVIREYNSRLSQLAMAEGWSFVDVASVMYDAQGVNLNRDYCSDPDGLGVHFTEAGCDAWIDYLYTHTP